jgi:fucose 4-O-acetylase-like acetyltransferase
MLSGIAFFKGYENKKYPAKIKSRIFTLIIPYLLWNTVWMIWEIFCSYSFLANFSQINEPYPLTALSVLKGIFFYGSNIPFWFIFDIIVFSFSAPLLFLILRYKYIGIASVICLSILSLFGIHLPSSIFYYPTALIFYLIGGIIGYHYFDFISGKSTKPAQVISVAFLFIFILTKNIIPGELHINNAVTEIIAFTLCSLALWNTTDIFIEKIKTRDI